MVDAIVTDLETLRERATGIIAAAESVGDRGTANLLDDINAELDKKAWMLNAWKKESARSSG